MGIGFVLVEEDALWLVQCHGDLSKTDGSGFDQDNEEVTESRDVLRGRHGLSGRVILMADILERYT